jgi:hypothetical protein
MNVKKVLAGTVAFSLLAQCSAFASSIETVEADVASDETKTVTVTVNYDSEEENLQSTLIVLDSDCDLALYKVSDIKYIKQLSADGKKAEFTFILNEDERKGSYTAYVGGTNIDAPGKVTFSFDKNTLSVTAKHEDTTSSVTVKVYDKDGKEVESASQSSDGVYSFSLDDGAYTVKITGKGILPYECSVTVSDGNASLGQVSLISGDVNSDGSITLTDLESVYTSWLGDDNADVNGDGTVTLTDLEIVYKNWLASSDTSYKN